MNLRQWQDGVELQTSPEKVPYVTASLGSHEEQVSSDDTQVQCVLPLAGCKLAK